MSAGRDYPYPVPLHAFQAQCEACLSHDTSGRLGAIAAPTLITVGSRDIFTPPPYSHAIRLEIPDAALEVFEDGGHTHHWDSLARFNDLTMEFMQRHPLPTRSVNR